MYRGKHPAYCMIRVPMAGGPFTYSFSFSYPRAQAAIHLSMQEAAGCLCVWSVHLKAASVVSPLKLNPHTNGKESMVTKLPTCPSCPPVRRTWQASRGTLHHTLHSAARSIDEAQSFATKVRTTHDTAVVCTSAPARVLPDLVSSAWG